EKVRHGIEDLCDGQSPVRLLDALVLHRGGDGAIERRQPDGLRPACGSGSDVLETMLDRAGSPDQTGGYALSEADSGGWGLRLQAARCRVSATCLRRIAPRSCSFQNLRPLADRRVVELRWAIPLWDAVRDSSATVLSDVWLGCLASQSAGLIQPRRA